MRLLSYFLPNAPYVFVYMLQQVEYDSMRLAKWLGDLPNLNHVQKRQKLELTNRAKITLAVCYFTWLVVLVAGTLAALLSRQFLPLLLILSSPLIAATTTMAFNSLFASSIVKPSQNKEIAAAKNKLAKNNATKIAVLGSYGKTSMKEMLTTILSKSNNVKATPANKNVLISHARWVNSQLNGDEDILIFEFGEYKPGDIDQLATLSQPDRAIITGLSSAHLDNYTSLDNIADDLASIFNYCSEDMVYVNHDSLELKKRISKGNPYSDRGIGRWKVKNPSTDIDGLSFVMTNSKDKLKLHSQLIGMHNIAPLTLSASLAKELGATTKQIINGVKSTLPFKHRMQPYQLDGAWVVDDTYNGNIEGMKAGLRFLKNADAKRKIYVTPGLVEQGDMVEDVHIELGRTIAQSNPDKVILMQNSATEHIVKGIKLGGFTGKLVIEHNPLDYYTNLEKLLAAGDLVLMQNDWPDSYN